VDGIGVGDHNRRWSEFGVCLALVQRGYAGAINRSVGVSASSSTTELPRR